MNQTNAELIEDWKRYMERGLIDGRPYSDGTVANYATYTGKFLEKYEELSLKNLRKAFLAIAPKHFAKRDLLYRSIISFSKYLVQEDLLYKEFLVEAKALKPVRHLPPRQNIIDEADVKNCLLVAKSIEDKAIINLLFGTGLRVSEACSLTWPDIDFKKGSITIVGKWGKRRSFGLTKTANAALMELKLINPGKRVLHGLTRWGVHRRLQKIGKKAGVHLHPHVLRAAFVTVNANKGRPMRKLQLACGHSSLQTTERYCRTTEQEVIEDMKGWD